MAIVEDLHVGDIGTKFTLTWKDENDVIIDLSTETTMLMRFMKPDRTFLEKEAVWPAGDDGTQGRMQYVLMADDLDDSGNWEVQGYVVITGWSGHSSRHKFKVEGNLQ